MSDDRNRFNYLTHAAEEGKHLPRGLKSEKHIVGVVKDYAREAVKMRRSGNTSVEFKISGPFLHNLLKKKCVNRKVFTFQGMQSTHGVNIVFRRAKCTITSIQTLLLILGLYTFLLHSIVDA